MDSYRNRNNTEAKHRAGGAPVFDAYDLKWASELRRTSGNAVAAETPGIAALLGNDLRGASGQPIGVIADLLLHPGSGQVLYALVDLVETGAHPHKKRFMLPVSCISSESNQPWCPFEQKQFEYGPQWRDSDGLFRLERHLAYWTGLLPDSGNRHPEQNETYNSPMADRREKE